MAIVKRSTGLDFYNKSIKMSLDDLKKSDKDLYRHLHRAFNDIFENAFCGIQIPKKLFPKEYKNFDNLWKYNLPGAWRLIYTIKSPSKIEIITVILNWVSHKKYEKLFRY